jgi:hypothetical protein
MNIRLAYRGHSGLADAGAGQTLSLAPNLARDPVAYDAPLLKPLRFREAISALHDVVISDLRFRKRDKTNYLEWKKRQSQQDASIRRQAFAAAKEKILAARDVPVPKDLDKQFRSARTRYWSARQAYANYLYKHDVEMWRLLMPCDPVITVAEDVCFFECFSGDESSYGCLTVDREGAFGKAERIQYGTTNVDYSWDLYHHFQALRSYRDTRFKVDPEGFEVATGGQGDYREEKIDLPQSWLRGFMQIQAAMGMPATRVSLSREAVYSLLAWLKRHKAWTSPRAMRFELVPGKSPRIVMEPWEVPVESYATRYEGAPVEAIRIWGTRRLVVLGRLLPLADAFDVYLLGTGLPSFWVARMGDMRLTLGLSGWTANDWTRSSALDMLAPPAYPTREQVDWMANVLREKRAATFKELVGISFGGDAATTAAALRHLAYAGQLIYDLHAGVYRWRQIMPQAVGEAEIGPEHEEMKGLRELLRNRRAAKDRVKSREQIPGGGEVIAGHVSGNDVEILIDGDGRIRRGKCQCGHYRRFGIRNGPCRHMMAVRYWK